MIILSGADFIGFATAWQDIGSPAQAGAFVSLVGGLYTIDGGGLGIIGTSDKFFFVYKPHSGNGHMSCRVVTQENTNATCQAMVMMRETLNANSKFAGTGRGPSFYSSYYRLTTGGSVANLGTTNGSLWIGVKRVGDLFSFFRSADGVTWVNLSDDKTVVMTDPIRLGLAVSSKNDSNLSTVTIDNVSFAALF